MKTTMFVRGEKEVTCVKKVKAMVEEEVDMLFEKKMEKSIIRVYLDKKGQLHFSNGYLRKKDKMWRDVLNVIVPKENLVF